MDAEIDPPFAVLHVPHSSRTIPRAARDSIILPDELLERELLRMTDSFTDELFQLDPEVARSVVFPVSRLVVDPERFLDDAKESMSVRGMGVIYTRTSDGGLLRGVVDAGARERLIAEYFRPHHDAVSRAVCNAVERWGRCLVVDCHSFPSVPLPYELDQSRDRPEICLGTDEFHSPRSLVNVARGLFHEAGFRVLLDRPFSGALVPESHYRRDARVMAIMVEVNRALYMNEASGERLPAFSAVSARLRQALVQLIEGIRRTE